MKKKISRTIWFYSNILVAIGIIYFLWSIGVLGGIIKSGYEGTVHHLDKNTTATIYRLFVDIIIVSLLIWRRK